jgi:hypothetical protein
MNWNVTFVSTPNKRVVFSGLQQQFGMTQGSVACFTGAKTKFEKRSAFPELVRFCPVVAFIRFASANGATNVPLSKLTAIIAL